MPYRSHLLTDFVHVSYARLFLACSSKCEVNHSIINAKTCSILPIILPVFRVVTLNELCVHTNETQHVYEHRPIRVVRFKTALLTFRLVFDHSHLSYKLSSVQNHTSLQKQTKAQVKIAPRLKFERQPEEYWGLFNNEIAILVTNTFHNM